MAIPAWFEVAYYFKSKLASMPAGTDSLALTKAFNDAGFGGEQGMYNHFAQYGQYEGLSPNAYFNANQYMKAKACEMFGVANPTEQQLGSAYKAFEAAGHSAWSHYVKYGDKEGLNPSDGFNTNKYLDSKLAQVQASNPAYTMDMLKADIAQACGSALQHYLMYGIHENLSYTPAPGDAPEAGYTYNLTKGDDTLYGSAGNDYFFAPIGTLTDGDYIDGLGGTDTLYAHLNATNGQNVAIQPQIYNVENIVFRVQSNGIGNGNNLPDAQVDAGDIHGMTRLKNDNSRATLTVEDVRTNSNDMYVAWADSDPGRGVDYEVYFDAQHLKSDNPNSTGVLQLRLMDVKNADPSYTPTSTPNVQPLTEQPFDKFSFKYTGTDKYVTLYLKGEDGTAAEVINGPDATYGTLLKAFQDAIARQGLSGVLKAELGAHYSASTTVDGTSYNSQPNIGEIIVLTSLTGGIEAPTADPKTGWGVSTGNVPSTGGIVWSAVAASTPDCPLIRTNIELDNVGRVQWTDARGDCLPDEAIWGSESGDMIVGSMAARGGIERFDVTVDRGSWLSSLSSTNQTLRMITVNHADINGDGQIGKNVIGQANDGNYGQLYIGKSLAQNAADELVYWTDKAAFLSTDGLVDVKEFDASAFNGALNIGASITDFSFTKYLRDVDGKFSIANLYAPKGDFHYQLGTGDDRLNMEVNTGVAADNDFRLVIDAGLGNDKINFGYSGPFTAAEYANMIYLRNVVINAGDGNDVIRFAGGDAGASVIAGAVRINAGAGNDVVYAGQNVADQDAVFVFNVGGAAAPAENRAVFFDAVEGAQPLNNNLLGTVPTVAFTLGGTPTLNDVISLRVTFKGFTATVALHTVTAADVTAAGFTMTTRDINKAIITAINDNATLQNWLIAKDGAGDSLIVEALVDGLLAVGDLGITFVNTTTAANTAATASTAYSTLLGTNANAAAADDGAFATAYDGLTGGYTLEFTAPTAGQHFFLTVDGVTYHTAAVTGATDLAMIAALRTARDASGNLLTSKFNIGEDSANIDDQSILLTSKTDRYADTHEINRLQVIDLTAAANVTGTNLGTVSKNWVNGGSGDDVIALNIHSDATNNDILIISDTNIGNDKILGFQTTIDKIDVTAMLSGVTAATFQNAIAGYGVGAAAADLVATATLQNVAFVATGVHAGTAGGGTAAGTNTFNVVDFITTYANADAGLQGLVFWANTATGNTYTVFQVKNDGTWDGTTTNALLASEVTLVGTMQLETTAGMNIIANGDLNINL